MLTMNRVIILLAVEILGNHSHGNHVANLIINTTKRHETLRSGVYPALYRMRDLGLVDMWRAGEDTPRPFYSLTKRGRDELKRTLNELEALTKTSKIILRKAATRHASPQRKQRAPRAARTI